MTIEKKEVKRLLTERALETAVPYEPITNEYLTISELLRLFDLKKKTREYYRVVMMLSKSANKENNVLLPDYIKKPFMNDVVRIHTYKGSGGSVKLEYRIAITDLKPDYRNIAEQFVSERITGECKPVSPRLLRKLKMLSTAKKKPVVEILNELVEKELQNVFRSP